LQQRRSLACTTRRDCILVASRARHVFYTWAVQPSESFCEHNHVAPCASWLHEGRLKVAGDLREASVRVQTRPAVSDDDLAFMRQMLLEASFWRPNRSRPSMEEALSIPTVGRFVRDWGRPGDAALIACAGEQRLGAAWYRLFGPDEPSRGYIDSATPELAIAVAPDCRLRGVGTALLTALIEQAQQDGFAALSLAVTMDNPAVTLYERVGFEKVVAVETAWTMRKALS
jgi:[ribosomal protein S18]-alanine N-acetyltransferase